MHSSSFRIPRSLTSKLLVITFVLVDALFLTYLARYVLNAAPGTVMGDLLGKTRCDAPIAYAIGTFDERFGLSREAFLDAIERAAHVWEDAAGKKLFVQDETRGSLRVNLVYDYRQEATDRLKTLGISIRDDRETYDELRATYDSLRTQLTKQRTAFSAAVDAHNARVAELEARIVSWNDRGGAPAKEFARITRDQEALRTEEEKLQAQEAAVNALVDDLNAVVPALNALAKKLNLQSVDYNETAAPLTKEFEEGVYVVSATSTQITIFQYESAQALVLVLEHELGHALGLTHVENPDAIMYRLNDGKNARPAIEDLKQLRRVCKISLSE